MSNVNGTLDVQSNRQIRLRELLEQAVEARGTGGVMQLVKFPEGSTIKDVQAAIDTMGEGMEPGSMFRLKSRLKKMMESDHRRHSL